MKDNNNNNLYDITRTALPADTKRALVDLKVDNFALLFNRLAHFGVKEDLLINNGNVQKLMDSEIKAHFFHKSQKQREEYHLDLTKKWHPSNDFKQQYHQFLESYTGAAKALFSSHKEMKLTANWRVAIGMGNESVYENGFTFHPTYGIPYLPGSSLKGMTRHWALAEDMNKKENENYLNIFGNEQTENKNFQQGRIIFFDAFPTGLKQGMLQPDIMNNHYPDYYEGNKPPADWLSPRPIFFLTMKGVEFQFHLGVIPIVGKKKNSEELKMEADSILSIAKTWLESALFESGVGAKTEVGYGRFGAGDTIINQSESEIVSHQNSESNSHITPIVNPSFQHGPASKKLKNGMDFEALVTVPGKPCKVTAYGFGDNTYMDISVLGSVQNLKAGDVIKIRIQTDGKGEKITSATFMGYKQK